MLPPDMFLRLPRPTALLLLSSVLSLTSAHIARQTPTNVPHRPLNVVAYPPPSAPTSPPPETPQALHELLLLRRQNTNTICGYIDGDPSLPATCSAGSHCVVDTDHGVIGCCPNGQPTCTAGVYTGCVDANSGHQTEVNPYVYTCTGANVCYKNVFEGGYSQFGCGTASSLAATVLESATGVATKVSLTSEPVSFTHEATSLNIPSVIDTSSASPTEPSSSSSDAPSSSSTASSSSSSDSSTSSKTTLVIPIPTSDMSSMMTTTTKTSSSPGSSSPTSATGSSSSSGSSPVSSSSTSGSTPTAAPATSGGEASSSSGVNRTGAIVGGSIGAVAAVVGLAAAAAYLLRRRAGNTRQGPGPRAGDTQYISPMSGGGGGGAFVPLGQQVSDGRGGPVAGRTIRAVPGSTRNTVWQYGSDGAHPDDAQFLDHDQAAWGVGAAGVGTAAAAGSGAFRGAYASPHDSPGEDQIPLWQQFPEIDDFSRNFNDALSRIGEEDEDDLEGGVNNGGMSGGGRESSTGDVAEARPLWLQSRRQSRNLMWT